jgi:hypothetical protein
MAVEKLGKVIVASKSGSEQQDSEMNGEGVST